MAIPQYRLTGAHFFAPTLVPADTIINFDGPPTREMEPLNQEAEDRLEEYYAKNPQAAHHAVEDLSKTVGDPTAEVEIVANPDANNEPVLTIGEAAVTKAKPGPTELGGSVPDIKKDK